MRLAYVHLPRFPVQRQVLERPSLTRMPFVLAEEVKGVRRVRFASTAAMREGVHPGMTLTAACALLHSLQTWTYQPAEERKALLSLAEALLSFAPAFCLREPDGMWLDASAASLFGDERRWAARVLEQCAVHGYQGRMAVASEVFTARAVAERRLERLTVARPEEGAQALAPLPLAALEDDWPLQISALRGLGLSTLGEVATLPAGALVARMGAGGLRVHQLCRGQDDSPLTPTELAAVVEERLALDWPAESLEPLLFSLKTVFDRIGARLSGRQRAAVQLTLTLKLDPTGEEKLRLSLSRPSAQPRLLLDLAKHRIADLTLQNPIGALSVRVDESTPDSGRQLALGDHPEGDAALEVVLSRLATRLGEEALSSAAVEASHRPEDAYGPAPFRPARPESGFLSGTPGVREPGPELAPAHRERPSRVFTQAAPLETVLTESGAVRGARVLGRHRKVLDQAGPERLQGEWWSEQPFCRDYYRVVFEGLGPVWIYRDGQDGRFYLHGMFD